MTPSRSRSPSKTTQSSSSTLTPRTLKDVAVDQLDYQARLEPKTADTVLAQVSVFSEPKSYRVQDRTTQQSIEVSVGTRQIFGYSISRFQNVVVPQAQESLQVELSPELLPNIIGNQVVVRVSPKTFNAKLILTSLESLVRRPHSCFEQLGARTFPLALLLQYIEAVGAQDNPLLASKPDIIKNLKEGINQMLLYKNQSRGGFSWFGRDRTDVVLNALALWQFMEINKLGAFVDQREIDSLLRVVLNEYMSYDKVFRETYYPVRFHHGGGRFRGIPPQPPSRSVKYYENALNSFIIFVLSTITDRNERTNKIIREILQRMSKENYQLDTYVHSLIGLTMLNTGRRQQAQALAKLLLRNQLPETGEFRPGKTSVTRSGGDSLRVESTALAVLFLQHLDFQLYSEEIKAGVYFLLRNMKAGYFGSTQATVLALKALTDNLTRLGLLDNTPQKFRVTLGGKAGVIRSNQESSDSIERTFDLSHEKMLLEIVPLSKPVQSQVFGVEFVFYSDAPESASESPLELTASRESFDRVEEYKFKVKNRSLDKQGMVIVVLHLPSYAKLNLNDLEELKSAGRVDFYEIRNSNSAIYFYVRDLQSEEEKEIDLVMVSQFEFAKADPVFVEAYLYYDKDRSIVISQI